MLIVIIGLLFVLAGIILFTYSFMLWIVSCIIKVKYGNSKYFRQLQWFDKEYKDILYSQKNVKKSKNKIINL